MKFRCYRPEGFLTMRLLLLVNKFLYIAGSYRSAWVAQQYFSAKTDSTTVHGEESL